VDNIFTSFIFGIEKGRFPYSISIRAQSREFLVFDDLMAASPCHLNCIPTYAYIPDLRSLFEQPGKGLKLLRFVSTGGWRVIWLGKDAPLERRPYSSTCMRPTCCRACLVLSISTALVPSLGEGRAVTFTCGPQADWTCFARGRMQESARVD
jgi:hypothetical protein